MFYFLSFYFADGLKLERFQSSSAAQDLAKMYEAFLGKRDALEVISEVEDVIYSDISIQEQIVVWEWKAKLLIYLKRFYECSLVLHQMHDLLENQKNDHLKWMVFSTESCMFWHEGKIDLSLQHMELCLDAVNYESRVHTFLLLEYALILSADCQFRKATQIVQRIEQKTNDAMLKNYVNILLYLSHIQMCRLESIQNYADQIDWHTDLFAYFQATILNAEKLYAILLYNNGGKEEADLLSDFQNHEGQQALIYYNLLRGNHEEAGILLRTIDLSQSSYFEDNDISSYLPIRVALAKRESYLARVLLEKKTQLRSVRYLDHFFLARVEYLERNTEKAISLFQLAYESFYLNDALSRMEFELDLACEFRNKDYRLYWEAMQAPNKAKSDGFHLLKIDENHEMLGDSPEITAVKLSIQKFAVSDLPILVYGETGTGKELAARAIHNASPRKNHPFLVINCGAIAENLLQSELFGHLQGAFTGASKDKIGVLEEAGEGTIFLDEIGEVSPAIQVALLRVLENNEFRPVGSSIPKKLRCRIIAATNAPLQRFVKEDRFRKDLLYRLQRIQITLPPLRNRRSDIPILVKHYLQSGHDLTIGVSEGFLQRLMEYSWPGNIRELRNEIESLVLLNPTQTYFTETDLPHKKFHDSNTSITSSLPIIEPVLLDQSIAFPQEEAVLPQAQGHMIMDYPSLNSRLPLRRQERLKTLFIKHQNLSRGEVARLMNMALNTASKDLAGLEAEGFIIKIKPSAAPRTHYYSINKKF